MTKKKILILIVAPILVAVIVVGAILKGQGSQSDLPEVAWTEVTQKTLEETVSGSGHFVSRRKTTLQPQIPGRIQSILAEDGQEVVAGDLLITLDDSNYRNATEQARVAYESTLRQSQEQLLSLRQAYIQAADAQERAADLLDRTQTLFSAGSMSRDSFLSAQDGAADANLTLEAARQRVNLALGLPLDATPPEEIEVYSEAVDQSPEVRGALLAVQAAEEELSHTRITAPSGGFITGLSLNPGDLVSQEVPLCRIESLDEMIAEITIDEVDIGKIALGDHVRITTDSLIGETLEGQVLSIAPVVERIGNLRAAVVKVSIDQEDRFLRAGASCLVKIDVRASQADVVIPVTGFFTQTGAIWVYKIAQGPTAEGESGDWVYTLEKTEIELGRSSLDEAVVTQGLVPGDRIAVGDLSSLRDGITVIPASQDLAEEDAQSGGETG